MYGEGNGTPLQYLYLENPWTEEPGGLQSMGSLRVRHDWATSLSLFTFMHWRRKWQPTPVFLPGESQGRWSLVGCHLWGLTELDTTEMTEQQQQHLYVSILNMETIEFYQLQFSSVQLPSHVWLFATPWTAACPASQLPAHQLPELTQTHVH